MSYYKELLLEADIRRRLSGPSFSPYIGVEEIDIGLEGLSISQMWESIKKLFAKVKDYFIRFFRWFKEKVLGFFKSKKVKRNVEKIKTFIDADVIEDRDLNDVIDEIRASFAKEIGQRMNSLDIESFRREKFVFSEALTNFPNPEIYSVVNKQGEVLNLSKQYEGIREIKTKVVDPAMKQDFKKLYTSNYDGGMDENILDGFGVIYAEFFTRGVLNGWSPKEMVSNTPLPKVSLREFYKKLENIDNIIKEAETFANQCERDMAPNMRKIEEEMKKINSTGDDPEGDVKKSFENFKTILNYQYFYIKASAIPLRSVTTYIRLLAQIDKRISSEKYITDKGLKFDHLYHLSTNPNLADKGELVPIYPRTGLSQFLPKRTSFAETVEGCYYGTPTHWDEDNLRIVDEEVYRRTIEDGLAVEDDYATQTKGNIYKRVIWLYEGFPDENTRYIKPKLIESTVGEAHLSKEICTTTPVKIKRVGLVEVEFIPSESKMNGVNNHFEYGKFINYRLIKKG